MQALLRFAKILVHCVLAFFRSRGEQTINEMALRQQLATYTQARPRPKLTSLDRAFWVALHQLWPPWREVLVIVKPETVIRWHRKGFRLYFHEKAPRVKACCVLFSLSPWRHALGFRNRVSTMLPFALWLASTEAGARWGP
jgi:hypothetical protein